MIKTTTCAMNNEVELITMEDHQKKEINVKQENKAKEYHMTGFNGFICN